MNKKLGNLERFLLNKKIFRLNQYYEIYQRKEIYGSCRHITNLEDVLGFNLFFISRNKRSFVNHVKGTFPKGEQCAKHILVRTLLPGERFLAKIGDPFKIWLTAEEEWNFGEYKYYSFRVSEECVLFVLIDRGRKLKFIEKINS